MADLGTAVLHLSTDDSKLHTGLDKAGKAVSVAMIGIGVAAAAGIGVAISKAGDLEQAVANISTIKPTIDTGQVFDALNMMSRRVPQTAQELGDALYNVFSSIDVTATEGLALVEKFAKGAVGAGTDAKTFGTAMLGVMNAYGLAVSDADHISDVFFNTVNAGVVSGEELAASLGPVTQSAKNAGVSLDELGALIAGVTKEGGPAAQNINNLNNLFMKVTTKEAQGQIAALGIKTKDAAGNFRPILDVMEDLKARLGPMTEAQRANALQAIFPDAQARTGAAVILSQLDFVNGALKTNQTAVGSASSAYEVMAATMKSQSKILTNTFDSILITIGSKLLPAITPLITAFAQWLPEAFAAAERKLEELKPVFATIGKVMSDIASVVIPPVNAALKFLGDNWESVVFAIKVLVLTVLLPAFSLWAGAAIAAAAATVIALLPVLVPIALIGAAAFLLHKIWTENMGGIQEKTATAVEFWTAVFDGFRLFILNLWKNIVLGIAGKVNEVIGFINVFIGAYNAVAEKLGLPIIGKIEIITPNLSAIDAEINAVASRHRTAVITVATVMGGGGESISSHQGGTPFVEYTGLHYLHRGEAVIPASENRGDQSEWVGPSQSSNHDHGHDIYMDGRLVGKLLDRRTMRNANLAGASLG